jgi:hypothetical protein
MFHLLKIRVLASFLCRRKPVMLIPLPLGEEYICEQIATATTGTQAHWGLLRECESISELFHTRSKEAEPLIQ